MKKKGLLLLLYIFVCLLIPGTVSHAAQQDEKKIITVGWYERSGYFEEDKDGNLSGFGMEYLKAIAKYTDWEYQFVKGTRRECLEWLENGQIDLLSPVEVNEELQNAQTAREVIGEDYGYIYKLNHNLNMGYGDYDSFRHLTVGIEAGSGLDKNLERYCQEHYFRFYNKVEYDTLDEMKKDLANGKLDALITDSYVNIKNMKVIGRFSNGHVSFAAANEEILEELNNALEVIKLNDPGFSEDLRELYFAEGSQNNLEYTTEEREFLSSERVYNVVLGKEQYPISYQGTGNVQFKGIAVDVLQKIEHYTGIKFNIRYVDTHAEGKQLLESGEADVLGGFVLSKHGEGSDSVSKELNDDKYTTAFYDMNMVLVGTKNTDIDEELRVAVPGYFSNEIHSLKGIYPYYEYLTYESDEACLEAVLSGEADVAVQSEIKINELVTYDKYQKLQNLKYIPGTYMAVFALNTQDEILSGILDKALNGISDITMSSIINNNIQHIAVQELTVEEFVYQYRGYIILIVLIVIVSNIAYEAFRKYKREEEDKEKAYRDSVANIGSMEKFRIDVAPILENELKNKYYVVAIDIDKFKVINDLYGYEIGDKVIALFAQMLKSELNHNDYITRINADNFIIMKYGETVEQIQEYLEVIFQKIDAWIQERRIQYRIRLKAGIYHIQEDDSNISSIMDKASLAKRNMKESHKSSYQIYKEDMRQKNIDAKNLENEMDEALENGEFCIYLQPQIEMKSKKIVSAEALVRWIHPQRGMIPPFKFIPVFEKNGFIYQLDAFVWEEAIKTVVRWRNENKIMVPIAINLSRADVERDSMIDILIALIQKYKLEPEWIKVELTESVCLDNDKVILEKMYRLKKFGLKVAVDDFGAGYSSLHLLKTMPIDILKIDKSFMEFEGDFAHKAAIVLQDVIEMGKHLNLQIIAEGVETREQSDFLEAAGCDVVQGYYYGKPMSVAEFEETLKENHEAGGM